MLLPGVPVRARALKPSIAALQQDELGAKLKRRRLELGLRQVEAAERIGVTETTIVDWERHNKKPMVTHYPAIISFLGYEPWRTPQTLGEKLLAARRRRGLSAKRAAELVGVDEGTFAGWEREKRGPLLRSKVICDRFIAA